jgi:hypothetical protein
MTYKFTVVAPLPAVFISVLFVIPILETSEMFVYRTDNSTFAPASMIRSIKRGEWALEDVKLHADMLFRSCEQAYANSTLPELPDFENVNDLLGEIAQEIC